MLFRGSLPLDEVRPYAPRSLGWINVEICTHGIGLRENCFGSFSPKLMVKFISTENRGLREVLDIKIGDFSRSFVEHKYWKAFRVYFQLRYFWIEQGVFGCLSTIINYFCTFILPFQKDVPYVLFSLYLYSNSVIIEVINTEILEYPGILLFNRPWCSSFST